MFDKAYRPIPSIIGVYCDYNHIKYSFRQKIKDIQHRLIDLRFLSKCNYRLICFDDSCALLDPIRNKILCVTDYTSSLAVLRYHLDNLTRLYTYEKDYSNIKNQIDYNDYQQLKKLYYE